MAISDDKKKMLTVIKKSDYSRLEAEAKKQMRSVSNLSLYYILEGLKKDEEKRAEAQ